MAPSGSVLKCSECGLPLYRMIEGRDVGDVIDSKNLVTVDERVPMPRTGLVVECPVHGAMRPNLHRPDGTIVPALGPAPVA